MPAPAALADERLAHLVPDLLGVDDHAVEVEDDGGDHAAVVGAVEPGERRAGLALLGALDEPDEERVIAGDVLGGERALQPADRPLEERAARGLDHVDAGPERDRRHPAREVLRERLLVGAEQRDGEAAGGAQQLVDRRLVGDRDA